MLEELNELMYYIHIYVQVHLNGEALLLESPC